MADKDDIRHANTCFVLQDVKIECWFNTGGEINNVCVPTALLTHSIIIPPLRFTRSSIFHRSIA